MDITRIDYFQLSIKDFLDKYPEYTYYSAKKEFWLKEIKRKEFDNEKRDILNKTRKREDDINIRTYKYIEENTELVKQKFWIDEKEIKKLLLQWNRFAEILNWQMINWRLVIQDLTKLCKML